MKKNILCVLVGVVLSLSISCSGKEANPSDYVPDVRILISKNDGKNWIENLKDIVVGDVFYLRVELTIENRKFFGRDTAINYSIAIPATEILECTLQDYSGKVTVIPAADVLKDFTRYDFTALASKKPNKSIVMFQCKALQAGTHRLQVTFDDNVNDMHSKNATMVYIEQKEGE